MAVSAFGLLILAAAVLFYIPLVAKMGVPRLIIGLFFILLCLLAMILGLSLPSQAEQHARASGHERRAGAGQCCRAFSAASA